jgi:hypothetical protein
MLYEALICPPHCFYLKLFLFANPSFYLCIYHVAKPPVKVNILVLKNISTCRLSPMILAKLVWKGKELLENVTKNVTDIFEGELDNLLLLYLLLFTLILNFLCFQTYVIPCLLFCCLLERILPEFG